MIRGLRSAVWEYPLDQGAERWLNQDRRKWFGLWKVLWVILQNIPQMLYQDWQRKSWISKWRYKAQLTVEGPTGKIITIQNGSKWVEMEGSLPYLRASQNVIHPLFSYSLVLTRVFLLLYFLALLMFLKYGQNKWFVKFVTFPHTSYIIWHVLGLPPNRSPHLSTVPEWLCPLSFMA